MMVRRASAFAALVALTALIATPGGASSCAWATQAPHGCCAEPAAQSESAAGSCCGEAVTPSRSDAPVQSGCDCLHGPGSPEAVAVGTPTSPATPELRLEVRAWVTGPAAELRAGTDHIPLDGGEPHPLFLLDCAFLT